ncbi:MAG: branched-chain amino acid ABC transporter substrate-binding protein [Thermomicrobiales bacterium]
MTELRFESLVQQFRSGTIDRRTFLARATILGVGAGAALRSMGVAAQDASPVASPAGSGKLSPDSLGVEGVPHITDTSKGTINLYSSWPMTGASVQLGGDSAEAVKLAVEIWGAAAGGFAINYQALDDGIAANNGSWDATAEAENATKVVNDPDCVAYIATYNSGAAEAAIPITNQAPLFQISPSNTAVQLTKENPANPPGYPEVLYPTGKRTYARVVPADDIQGSASANWAITTHGAKSVYILHDNQTYGKGVASVFRDTFKKLGGEVVGFEAFDANAPEYQALATKVANVAPDFIYIGAIVNLNASKLVQDVRDVLDPSQTTLMGPDGLINQAFLDGAGDAADGMFLTFGGLPPAQLQGAGKEWYEEMKARLGHEPDAYSVYSFECAVVVLQTIDKVGSKDRQAIIDAAMAIKDFRGLIGTWSFSKTGDTTASTISLNEVKGGQITFQEVIGAPE